MESVRRAARGLRLFAWFIAITSVVGYVMLTFFEDEQGYYMGGEGIRQRIGSLLTFIGTPFALAALVYATALLVTLYASRTEADAGRMETSPRES